METVDKFEQLAGEAQYAAVILSNPSLADFQLIDLDFAESCQDRRQRLHDAGYQFFGCMGLVNGVPKIAISEPLDQHATAAIRQAFQILVEERINNSLAVNAADVDWLESLHKLPDTRD